MTYSSPRTVQIGHRIVGDGRVFLVADMAWSHDGARERAQAIVEAAAYGGADAITLHLTQLEHYMVPHYGSGTARASAGRSTGSLYEYLQRISLTEEDWRFLFALARQRGLLVSALCNDLPSLELAAELNPDLYTVHASALTDEDFLGEVSGFGKPVVLGISGATLGEMERAVDIVESRSRSGLIFQYGFQVYPTKLPDVHLRFIPTLKQLFGWPVMFADHTDGGSELALILPLVGVAVGADAIEKHLTHDRSLRGEDFESALDPPDFRRFSLLLREVEQAFGPSTRRPLSGDELVYRQAVRKRVVARVPIPAGTAIGPDHLAIKRSDEGVSPSELPLLLGRVTAVPINQNEGITWEKLGVTRG